jgi:predicted dehydrogenase
MGRVSLKKIKVAIFGTGFMGRVHTESLRRLGNVEVVGVAGSTEDRARKFAEEVGIERATGDYLELLEDDEISAVHICSPNALHYEMTMRSLKRGKHVICEKPLASTVDEACDMIALAKSSGLANCTLYNMRSYPQIQNLRRLLENGDLGEVRIVQGTYSQDWLLYDTDWNWRVDSGSSRTFADIGTHWCDLVEHVTGLKITSLCADLQTFMKTRKRPKGSVETFKGKNLTPTNFDEIKIDTEDFGSMIFKMGDVVRGSMTTSQVSAGRKNRLFLEVYGTKASAVWDGERPEELWIGHRNKSSELLIKDSTIFPAEAQSYSDLPGGHSEGYDATFKQTFRRFYRTVEDRSAPIEYPTFEDGLRQLRLVDAVLQSSRRQAWITV